MLSRHKLLIFIPAALLIPILLWMTPVHMVHNLSKGCPFSHSKQILRGGFCLSNSAISHDDPTIVTLNVTSLDQESAPASNVELVDLDSIYSNIPLNFVPLRC